MLKLLLRNIACVERRLVLIAPPTAAVNGFFQNVRVDRGLHRTLVSQVQRLRGSVYLDDGAVRREHLSPEGHHRTIEDERSWHLLMRNREGLPSSCVWYREHDRDVTVDRLRVGNCPLAHDPDWADTLHGAVESELARARQHGLRYAEVGGWAVNAESRCTSEGLLLALGAYSLGRIAGGALGMTTATVRHSSSTILKRLGGSPLEDQGLVVPPYYDPRYNCQIELLRFDSRYPSPKYAPLVERLKEKLAGVLVIARDIAALPEPDASRYALRPAWRPGAPIAEAA